MDRRLIIINGKPTVVMCDATEKLSDVIRRQAGLTGTKVACGQGQCGSCSVILNGKVVRSCTTTMKRVPTESEITTIEGIGRPDKLHALQLAWILHGGAQCGYCSPGFIVSSKALLDQNRDPTREEVRDWWQKASWPLFQNVSLSMTAVTISSNRNARITPATVPRT